MSVISELRVILAIRTHPRFKQHFSHSNWSAFQKCDNIKTIPLLSDLNVNSWSKRLKKVVSCHELPVRTKKKSYV